MGDTAPVAKLARAVVARWNDYNNGLRAILLQEILSVAFASKDSITNYDSEIVRNVTLSTIWTARDSGIWRIRSEIYGSALDADQSTQDAL